MAKTCDHCERDLPAFPRYWTLDDPRTFCSNTCRLRATKLDPKGVRKEKLARTEN